MMVFFTCCLILHTFHGPHSLQGCVHSAGCVEPTRSFPETGNPVWLMSYDASVTTLVIIQSYHIADDSSRSIHSASRKLVFRILLNFSRQSFTQMLKGARKLLDKKGENPELEFWKKCEIFEPRGLERTALFASPITLPCVWDGNDTFAGRSASVLEGYGMNERAIAREHNEIWLGCGRRNCVYWWNCLFARSFLLY